MIDSTFEELRTQESEVPSLSEFRETVNTLTNIKEAAIIKLLYLGAFSCSEVVTKITPWELEHQASKPYGRAMDCGFTDYTINGKKEKVLLIRSLVAKRFKKRARLLLQEQVSQLQCWTFILIHHGSPTSRKCLRL